jgi:hypothetical protein
MHLNKPDCYYGYYYGYEEKYNNELFKHFYDNEMNIHDVIYFSNSTFTGIDFTSLYSYEISRCFFNRIYFDKCTFTDCKGASVFVNAEFNECTFNNVPLVCPATGSFTAYKAGCTYYYNHTYNAYDCSPSQGICTSKEYDTKKTSCEYSLPAPVIIKLTIPATAERSSAFSNKCRASEAIVEDIYLMNSPFLHLPQATNYFYSRSIIYKLHDHIIINDFDKNRYHECSTGIHFFMTELEACEFAQTH